MRRFMSILCAAAAVQLAPAVVKANSEAVVGYDARSAGLAFTGAAYADSASAILHNPANLTDIKRLSIDISFNPELVQLKSQVFNGQAGGVSTSSPFNLSPLGFVGVAYKGHPRFVIGVAGMMMDIGGVKYNDVPFSIFGNPAPAAVAVRGKASAALLSYEVRIPVAIKVTDWLSVAGAYRMTFANKMTNFNANGVNVLQRNLAGRNYSSAQAGIMIKPMPELQFGLNYRSRTKIELGGELKTIQSATLVSEQQIDQYVAPHQFTAGVATRLLDQKLLLTGDFKYWMYSDAYKGQGIYHDAMSGHIAAEYHLSRYVPVRAGYFVGRSAITDQGASAFTTAPKIQMGGSLGAGAHFDLVNIDAAVIYGEAGGNIAENTMPGKYHLRLVGFGVSASFKI